MILPLLGSLALAATPFTGELEPKASYTQPADSLRALKQHVEALVLKHAPRHVAVRVDWEGAVDDAPGVFTFEVTKKDLRAAGPNFRHEYFVRLVSLQPLPAVTLAPGPAKLRAITANAKAGAVLVLPKGAVVYVAGKDGWADAEAPKLVTAQGTLVERKLIPDPVKDEKGAISQGAAGTQWVLEKAQLTFDP